MDKYDYITATVEEEKIRLGKILFLLKDNPTDELSEYQERYSNIVKYLTAKSKFLSIKTEILETKKKLEKLNKNKAEYEVDNILLEDTLLSKFHEDTENIYRNMLYEDIKNEDLNIRDILYTIFEKQTDYTKLIIKRNRLISIIDKVKYPKTYNTLQIQAEIIEKQNSLFDEIYILENNIKMMKEEQRKIENMVMIEPILKILYEFWIIDSYDEKRVDRSKIFEDNRTLVNIKNTVVEEPEEIIPVIEEENEETLIPNLNLPGINENILIDIDGKNYVKNEN